MQENDAPIVVIYNGIEFRRNPDAKDRAHRVYYTPPRNSWRDYGIGSLHVEIWRDAHGRTDVPEGHIIHHVDHNPFNNDPSNLEAVTYAEHAVLHKDDLWRGPKMEAHLERIRPLASAWHSSESGRRWHSENSFAWWAHPKMYPGVCENCGFNFESPFSDTRFCSKDCSRKLLDKNHRYERQVPCPVCGVTFWQNLYRPRPTACSRKCAWVLRKRR